MMKPEFKSPIRMAGLGSSTSDESSVMSDYAAAEKELRERVVETTENN